MSNSVIVKNHRIGFVYVAFLFDVYGCSYLVR